MFDTEVSFRVLKQFTHKASVTSVNAEANVHTADWLISAYLNEFGSPGPAPCAQSTRLVRAALLKDYERDLQ